MQNSNQTTNKKQNKTSYLWPVSAITSSITHSCINNCIILFHCNSMDLTFKTFILWFHAQLQIKSFMCFPSCCGHLTQLSLLYVFRPQSGRLASDARLPSNMDINWALLIHCVGWSQTNGQQTAFDTQIPRLPLQYDDGLS